MAIIVKRARGGSAKRRLRCRHTATESACSFPRARALSSLCTMNQTAGMNTSTNRNKTQRFMWSRLTVS